MLVGPAGTGKSHMLVALGRAAVDAGHRVRYFSAAELVDTLYRGLADNSVGRVIKKILCAEYIILDDLGFAPLDRTGAQLLFRFVAAAYERAPSAWPATGPSRNGDASSPNTPPQAPCSTASSTAPTSSSPKATATACAKPRTGGPSNA